ncbi:MAG: TPM domain-containing protein [Cellulomonadaceae bacterium]|nr:TPM domain-containing protein [Cellulomonadaceae bacterium]
MLGLVAATALTPAPAAQAAEPLPALESLLTDDSGLFTAAQAGQVTDALERVQQETQFQLFIVYVDTFAPLTADEWADQTAINANLSSSDVVIVIATDDHTWGYSTDVSVPISRQDMGQVIDALAEKVNSAPTTPTSSDTWAQAGVAAADTFTAVMTGVSATPGGVRVSASPELACSSPYPSLSSWPSLSTSSPAPEKPAPHPPCLPVVEQRLRHAR